MLAWTDYPIGVLGDLANEPAPIRQVDVLAYDQDKHCLVVVLSEPPVYAVIKTGYIYQNRGAHGEQPAITRRMLSYLHKLNS